MDPSRSAENETRRRLIEAHLPLVRGIASRYAGRGEPVEDLVQAGSVALVKAADRFDATRGVAFASFAAPAIEGEIRRHLGDRVPAVRIPRQLQRMTGQLRRSRADLRGALGREPTTRELADALGADEEDLTRALRAGQARDAIPLDEDTERFAGQTDALAETEERVLVGRGARVLDDRERRIVFLRFHADMTEREIARAIGISQAHVSRLLAAALEKLRPQLAGPTARDITEGEAISPASAPSEVVRSPTWPSSSGSADLERDPRATAKIGAVGAPRQKPELARLLALPYHVAVRSENAGGRTTWTAAVEELPGCQASGATPNEATDRLQETMEAWLTAALAERRDIPSPGGDVLKRTPAPRHSGRFLVRMPGALHEQLAQAAEREQVSLNRFVTDTLAAAVAGGEPAGQASPDCGPDPVESKLSPAHARPAAFRVALATNLIIVVLAGLLAVALLIIAVEHGV